jgi:hypothetical protein
MNLLHRSVGSHDHIGIDFEVKCDVNARPDTWWGRLSLWANGQHVGNDEVEMVSVGLGSLWNAALKTHSRKSALLSHMPSREALDTVMQSIYGDENLCAQALVNSTDLSAFEVLPQGDPFFDDWEAILIEVEEEERFILQKKY